MSQRSPQRRALRSLRGWIFLTALLMSPGLLPPTAQPGSPQEPVAAQRLQQQGVEQAKNRQFTAALQSLNQALALFQQAQDWPQVDTVLRELDRVYSQMGDKAGMVAVRQQRMALARQRGDRYKEALFLRELGHTYVCLNDFKQAIAVYQQLNVLTKEKDGETLSDLGYALLKTGQLAAAETHLRAALATVETAIPASTPTTRPSHPATRTQVEAVFEAVLDDDKQREQAEAYYHISKSLQQVLVTQNRPDAALEMAERGRTTALMKLLASHNASTQSELSFPTIQQLKQIARSHQATLVEYSIMNDQFRHECLGDRQTIYQALRTQQQTAMLFIWVIKPTGDVHFRQIDLAPVLRQNNTLFPELVANTRGSLGMSKQRTSLKQFYDILIQPIHEFLPKDEQAPIIFIADEALFYVPFPALVDAKGRYLIEQHTLLTAPSMQMLHLTQQLRKQKPPGQGALVVGNPAPMPMQLAALPGAEREARAIAQLLNTQPLLGNQATKSRILEHLFTAKIIHLATHGILNERNGKNSAITVAAPAAAQQASFDELLMNKPGLHVHFTFPTGRTMLSDNGLISAGEILSLSRQGIPAELVVLSACDTGLGEITGDGIVGLSRSLLAAGIPNLVVSLWAVPDQPTEVLMVEFYRQLQRTANKATALRNAMLFTMKQFPSPRDWAAFTLIGESQSGPTAIEYSISQATEGHKSSVNKGLKPLVCTSLERKRL